MNIMDILLKKRAITTDGYVRSYYLMRISVLYLCLFIVMGCKSPITGGNNTSIKEDKEYVLRLLPGINNPRNSEGDFITLKDGRILFIYSHYTGTSADDHAHAYLAGRFSDDQGKTWSSEDAKIVEQEGKMNVMSVSLLRLKNGEIAFFYLRKNSVTDCIPMLRTSNNEANTWSDPVPCITDMKGYFVLNNSRVIQLKDGRLLLAVAMHQRPGEENPSAVGRIWSYYSDDNGKSWKRSAEVLNPHQIVTQEPGMIELKDGNILMFLRTTAGVQYFSYSNDKGENWSTVVPGNIKSPCSPASITRIPSTGDLLLVWNDNGTDQKRTPFNIAISKDEGKTWINNKILENNPDGSFCYPAIHYINNELLLSYYDWSTLGSTIMRISIDWLYR